MVGRAREDAVTDASLRAWLSAPRVPASYREAARRALSTPWCWPVDATLASAATRLCAGPPEGPRAGEVLLVSVAAREDREALWTLSWDAEPSTEACPFGATAQRGLREVASLATAVSPHLHTLAPLAARPTMASPVFKRGRSHDVALDDVSYGLSMLLALVSRLTERPVAARFAASAEVSPDGAIRGVAGLERKLALLADAALAVDMVLVAREQRDAAAALTARRGWRFTVAGVSRADEAIDAVFPEARARPPEAWRDERSARAAIESLFELCRDGGAVRDWSAVSRSADWLTRAVSSDARLGVRARFAAKVARRHADRGDHEIPWGEFVRGREAVTLAAHAVQAAADAGSSVLTDYLDRATALIAEDPDSPEGLALAGAVGRGLAALRRYEEAAETLRRVTRAWFDRGAWGESSYPLSEWLRASAITGDRSRWSEAVEAARHYLSTQRPPDDAGPWFVRFALGRGLALMGDPTAALEALDEPRWERAPPWLSRTRRRWRAIALDQLGRNDEARALRETLAREPRGSPDVVALLAATDEALTERQDPSYAITAVRRANPQGLGWLVDDALTVEEQARRVATEYPY